MDDTFDIKHYLGILRRRSGLLILITAILFSAGSAIAYLLPPVYTSTAKILVESQQIPDELARSTVTTNAVERIQIIQQRLMTRTNLLKIAKKYNLYSDSTIPYTPSEIVEQMRESAEMVQLATGNGRRNSVSAIVFTITFENKIPVVASRVANEFVTLILEQNIKSRIARASETQEFFKQETQKLEEQLSEIEIEISVFKQKNAGVLPSDLRYNRELAIGLQRQISDINNKISAYEEQKKLIADRYAVLGKGTLVDGTLNAEQVQLNRLNLELVQKRSKYSESHPYVKLIVSQIAALEKSLKGQENDAQPVAGEEEQVADPVSVSIDIPDSLLIINSQLNLLNSQRSELAARVTSLRDEIKRAPQVELVLNDLNRKHEKLQAQFRDSSAKLSAANTGEKLEEGKQAERFEIVEQATVAEKPIKPNRALIMSLSLLLGLAVSLGTIVLLEVLNQTVRSARDLQKWLKVRPFAELPFLETKSQRRLKAIKSWSVFGASVSTVFLAVFAVHMYYQPIDVLIGKIADRSGIQNILEVIKTKIDL